jgi:uncharacterized protein DUF4159
MKATALVAVALALAASTGAEPQRRGRFGFGPSIGVNAPYDGAFQFCRITFRNSTNGDGNGWWVDYPRADTNFTFRLGELTKVSISRRGGDFNHIVLRLTDDEMFRCPFIMMTEPGGAYFDDQEAARLREYLLKGGFLWADDFWGEYAWDAWVGQIRKALPDGAYPIRDLPPDHSLFHMLYVVNGVRQIPSIGFWFGTGGQTSERGRDSAVPHARAIADENGRVMVLMTHNTDYGDAFEREGDDRRYFDAFASDGYALGINVLLYALLH